MTQTSATKELVLFESASRDLRHWKFSIQDRIATLAMNVDEDGGLRPGYKLKLNSYDLGVDIELRSILQRIRFEHPEVACVAAGQACGPCARLRCSAARFKPLASMSR